MTEDLLKAKQEYADLLAQKVSLQEGLPHLHGYKWYKWARTFVNSTNPITLISKANQISGSSTQIRKTIYWATAIHEWPKLWRTTPRQFWYLYPTRDVAHIEYTKKWKPEFLPRNEYQDHPVYGWKPEFSHNRIWAIHFNSGVSVYFKTYGQDVGDLQTGTVHYLAFDEELPEELWSELSFRVSYTNGYISGVFTPTLGQEFWREAMEEKGTHERFPEALKQTVSMYDCLHYDDGSESPWSVPQIERAKAACKSEAEVQRRVFGRFVSDSGLKYGAYSRTKHRIPAAPIPSDWSYYCGVDSGSGGKENHPAAITIVAVSPDFKKGRAIRGWRGDGEDTTSGIIANKCFDMIRDLPFVTIYYDYSDRDFYTIAVGMGLTVFPAEKGHAIGEQVINVLFKNSMLLVYDLPELDPLSTELSSLKKSTPKTKAKDDAADSLRYAVTRVPWDWSEVKVTTTAPFVAPKKSPQEIELAERRKHVLTGPRDEMVDVEDELDAWNELMAGGGYLEA